MEWGMVPGRREPYTEPKVVAGRLRLHVFLFLLPVFSFLQFVGLSEKKTSYGVQLYFRRERTCRALFVFLLRRRL